MSERLSNNQLDITVVVSPALRKILARAERLCQRLGAASPQGAARPDGQALTAQVTKHCAAANRGGAGAALAAGNGVIATLHAVGKLQERLARLGSQANKSPEEIQKLTDELFRAASQKNIRVAPDRILDAIESIVAKTGDLDLAQRNLQNIGLLIQGAGMRGEDAGALVAELAKGFDLKGGEDMLRVISALVNQAKAGSLSLRSLAAQGKGVIAAYTGLGRVGPQAVKEMGALLQVFNQGLGSPERAAGAVEAMINNLAQKSGELRGLGVEIWDQDALAQGRRVFRSVPAILSDIVEATGGDLAKLSGLLGNNAAKVLVAEYQKQGRLASLDSLLAVKDDPGKLLGDSGRAAGALNASLQSLETVWQRFAQKRLTGPLQSLADLVALAGDDTMDLVFGAGTIAVGAASAVGTIRKVYREMSGLGRAWRGGAAGGRGKGKSRLARLGSWLIGAGQDVQPVEVVNWPDGFGSGGDSWLPEGGEGDGKKKNKGKGRKKDKRGASRRGNRSRGRSGKGKFGRRFAPSRIWEKIKGFGRRIRSIFPRGKGLLSRFRNIIPRGKGLFSRLKNIIPRGKGFGGMLSGLAGMVPGLGRVMPSLKSAGSHLAGAGSRLLQHAGGGILSKVGGKATAKAAGKLTAKVGAKIAGKSVLKGLLKKIPGVSLVAGAAFAAQRAMSGDWLGAAGELASGLLSTIPGVGTAASAAVDIALAARDMANASQEQSSGEEQPAPQERPLPGDQSLREQPGLPPAASERIDVNINQVVNLAPGATAQGLEQVLTQSRERLRREVEEIVRDMFHRQRRVSFGAVSG